MYSRIEVCDARRKLTASVCLDSLGRIDVLGDGYTATGRGIGRFQNVVGSWAAADAEGRTDDTAGIDGGRQSKEEDGSGKGLGEHLNNEWMKVRRMTVGTARDGLCRTRD